MLILVICHYIAEKVYLATKCDEKSNWKTFKNVTRMICSSLSQIGDDNLVLQMLEKIIVDQIVSQCSLVVFRC